MLYGIAVPKEWIFLELDTVREQGILYLIVETENPCVILLRSYKIL